MSAHPLAILKASANLAGATTENLAVVTLVFRNMISNRLLDLIFVFRDLAEYATTYISLDTEAMLKQESDS